MSWHSVTAFDYKRGFEFYSGDRLNNFISSPYWDIADELIGGAQRRAVFYESEKIIRIHYPDCERNPQRSQVYSQTLHYRVVAASISLYRTHIFSNSCEKENGVA